MKKTNIIYLSVKFGDYGKPYYYITEDDSIGIGEQVVVPVGDDGTEGIVEIVKKQYFSSDNVPMPIEKVKHIIGLFVPPQKNAHGKQMIYCPMFQCEIDADDCYDILYDPCFVDFDGIFFLEGDSKPKPKELNNEKREICKKCKYHGE